MQVGTERHELPLGRQYLGSRCCGLNQDPTLCLAAGVRGANQAVSGTRPGGGALREAWNWRATSQMIRVASASKPSLANVTREWSPGARSSRIALSSNASTRAAPSPARHRMSKWPCFSSVSSVTFSIAGRPSDKTSRSWLVCVTMSSPAGLRAHF